MQRLDHAGALGPATPHPARQGDHRDLAVLQGRAADPAVLLAEGRGGVVHVAGTHVADVGGYRQAILGQADAARTQVLADLLVLGAVKAVAPE